MTSQIAITRQFEAVNDALTLALLDYVDRFGMTESARRAFRLGRPEPHPQPANRQELADIQPLVERVSAGFGA